MSKAFFLNPSHPPRLIQSQILLPDVNIDGHDRSIVSGFPIFGGPKGSHIPLTFEWCQIMPFPARDSKPMPRSANRIDNSPRYPEPLRLRGHMFAVRVEEEFGMSMRLKCTIIEYVLGSSEQVLSI